jgi:hypothetical protein
VMRTAGRIVAFALVFAACLPAGCAKKDEDKIRRAREVAKTFHDAVLRSDVRAMLDCSDYPFRFDSPGKDGVYYDEETLKPFLEKKRLSMFEHVQAANVTEVIAAEDFLGGAPFAGQTLSKEKAAVEASKIGLKDGGMIVRCFFEDKATKKQDGRGYYLVMHPNSLGDMKVTTYWD